MRALVVLLLVTVACAGSGVGLDEFGNPLGGDGGGPLAPTLASIQARIFTPICTQCHAGAAAPLGLSLEAGASFDNLVGVPSSEVPALLRVQAGNPDASYLVRKIEGSPDIVGDRMPLGLTPLTTEERTAIRGWIAAGAPKN